MMFIHAAAQVLLAQAENGGGKPPAGPLDGAVGTLVPLALMFGIIYFLLIRPASKQRKEHASMLNALKKNDEVVTTGGIYGRIISIEDKVATLEISNKVTIKIMRDRIAGRWEPEKAVAAK